MKSVNQLVAEIKENNEDFELPTVNTEINVSDWNNFNICTKDGKVFANVKLYKNGNSLLKKREVEE